MDVSTEWPCPRTSCLCQLLAASYLPAALRMLLQVTGWCSQQHCELPLACGSRGVWERPSLHQAAQRGAASLLLTVPLAGRYWGPVQPLSPSLDGQQLLAVPAVSHDKLEAAWSRADSLGGECCRLPYSAQFLPHFCTAGAASAKSLQRVGEHGGGVRRMGGGGRAGHARADAGLRGRNAPGGFRSLQEPADPRREHGGDWCRQPHCFGSSCPPAQHPRPPWLQALHLAPRAGLVQSRCQDGEELGMKLLPHRGPFVLAASGPKHPPVLGYRPPQPLGVIRRLQLG